jgi:hypothetical protein
MIRKKIITAILVCSILLICACGKTAGTTEVTSESSTTSETTEAITNLAQIDNTKWQYNEEDDVYYQLGITYCENPADTEYEELAIIVPAAYMEGKENGDGTYTCTLSETGQVNGYTASTAPVVFPVNTPGYSAQSPMTEYSSASDYTSAGFIYVHAGCRGRDAGAPAGVTDLKAAIRYIRYNAGNIAGDMDRIFTFGMSGGGAQSVLVGVTGDSDLYDDYLKAIGAVQGVSDSVLGSQSWCPITSLDSADEAYEWMMATSRSGLSDEEQKISDNLTAAYADYINGLGLTDTEGKGLTLEESEDGRYQSGSYYEYMKSVIEESLNNFLANTEFPYDADASSQGHQAGMGPDGGNGGQRPDKGDFNGQKPEGMTGDIQDKKSGDTDFTQIDDISRNENTSGVSISGTYETAADYIDALNANGTWVNYDESTNTATISSIADFAKAVKTATKGIAAFDQLDGSQGENTLFGYGDGEGAHFDSMLAQILNDIGSSYSEDYKEDLEKEDAQGHTVDYRLNMYSPLYYLLSSSEGYQSANMAKYFRINTGLWQSDTAVNTEANLVLALKNYGSNVDYSFVWGQEHTMAESSGDSTTNFISWVNECVSSEN